MSGRTSHGISALLDGWVHGWALSRATSAPVPLRSGWRIEVGLPGHRARVVLPAVDRVVSDVAGSVTDPGHWLKVCGDRGALEPLLPLGWSVGPPEYLMSTADLDGGPAAAPAAYAPVFARVRPGVIDVELLDQRQHVAARGRVAVVGRAAVLDQIVTEPAHRRRGLAGVVVRRLLDHAVQAGAHTAVLVATEDGRGLYQRLGWTLRSPVTAAVSRSVRSARPAAARGGPA